VIRECGAECGDKAEFIHVERCVHFDGEVLRIVRYGDFDGTEFYWCVHEDHLNGGYAHYLHGLPFPAAEAEFARREAALLGER